MNIFKSIVAGFIVAALVAAIYVVGIIWGAWVLTVLWAWFIVPLFHLPELRMIAALGVMTVARFLTYNTSIGDQIVMENMDNKEKLKQIGGLYFTSAFVLPLIFLVSGWIYQFFL
jgi:hypothetical protein